MSGDGSVAVQMCVTADMSKAGVPGVGNDGSCQPTNVRGSGGHMTYAFSCDSGGTTINGTGEAVVGAAKVTTRSTSTVVDHGQTYQLQSETEYKFLNSDCGNVKPIRGVKPESRAKNEGHPKPQ
jgi:hypothetical protein